MSHLTKVLFFSAAIAASAGISSSVFAAPAKTDAISQYTRVVQVADALCEKPELSGWATRGHTSDQAKLSLDKFKKFVGELGLQVGGGAEGQAWHGPLQKDIGAALVAHSECREKAFAAMLNKGGLVEADTMRPVPKPWHVEMAFRDAQAQVRAKRIDINSASGAATQQQQTFEAPISQGAPVTSNGQTGGQTAGIIVNQFPVTPQEKEQALARLEAQIRELAAYPYLADLRSAPDFLENQLSDTLALRFFQLLTPYDQDTIKAVPEVGETLLRFKGRYYRFRQTQIAIEQAVYGRVADLVTVNIGAAKHNAVAYVVLRLSGLPVKEIQKGDLALIEVSWDQAEDVFRKVSSDPSVGPVATENMKLYSEVSRDALEILSNFRN